MSKTKVTYVAHTQGYQTDKRGNVKVVKIGTEISEKEFLTLSTALQSKFTRTEKVVGRKVYQRMAIQHLPILNGVTQTEFTPDEFHLLKGETRDLAEECAQRWSVAFPEIPFPGVCVGKYHGGANDFLTFFIRTEGLPADLPPFYSSNNNTTNLCPKKGIPASGYRFKPAALLNVTQRLRSGRPVFAYSEAIDGLLAEIRA